MQPHGGAHLSALLLAHVGGALLGEDGDKGGAQHLHLAGREEAWQDEKALLLERLRLLTAQPHAGSPHPWRAMPPGAIFRQSTAPAQETASRAGLQSAARAGTMASAYEAMQVRRDGAHTLCRSEHHRGQPRQAGRPLRDTLALGHLGRTPPRLSGARPAGCARDRVAQPDRRRGSPLLEEERLAQCRISTEWGSLALGKRLVSGYDGLRFLEFRRFWDRRFRRPGCSITARPASASPSRAQLRASISCGRSATA